MPGSSAECGWSSATSSYPVVSSAVSASNEREEGGRNSKYKADNCNTKYDMAIRRAGCVLTQCYMIPMKGEPIRESFPDSGYLSDR